MSAPRFVVLGGVSLRGPGGGNGVSVLPFGKMGSLASTPDRRLGQRASFLARTAIVSSALTFCLNGVALAQSTSCTINPSTPYQQSALQPVSPTAPLLPQLPSAPSTPNSPGTSLLPATPPAQPYGSTPMAPNTPSQPQQVVQQPNGTGGPMVPNTPSSPGTPTPPAAGTVFSDNFANGIDSNVWRYNFPYSSTCASNTNSDATQYGAYVIPDCPGQKDAGVFSWGANGLNIAIKPTPAGVNSNGKPYVTGQISSQQAYTVGHYFEMKATLPETAGTGGAFWLLPQSGAWPPEIDVMENLGENSGTIYQTLHDGTPGNVSNQQIPVSVAGGGQSVHTYGVDWRPNTTTFYTDGVKTGTFATPADMQGPMYMILSNNVKPPGNSTWGASVDGSSQFPQTFNIQNVRVLDKAPY